MSTDAEMTARIHDLAKRIYAARGALPVIDRKENAAQWTAWRSWRKEHGQPVNFMDTQQRFTVLTDWPPTDFEALELEYPKGAKKKVRQLK